MTIRRDFDNHREDVWAQRCFWAASQAIKGHCKLWERNYYRIRLPQGKFDTLENRIHEAAVRILIVAVDLGLIGAACCFPVAAASLFVGLPLAYVALRSAGSVLQQKGGELGGFSHLRGAAEEKNFENGSVKQMTLNVAALAGGLGYGFAGVRPWQQRIDGLVAMIQKEQPDVLVLQEVMDTDFSQELIKRLHGNFAHFFSHLGVSSSFPLSGGFAPGGVLMATTGAVSHFSDHPFTSNGAEQCRSFGCLELLDQPEGRLFARFLGTHLAWKEEDQARRSLQWQQMKEWIDSRQEDLPTFILADSNTERDGEFQSQKSWLAPYYTEENPTCWHRLTCEWMKNDLFNGKDGRQIDNIYLVNNEKQKSSPEEVRLVKMFEDDPTNLKAFDTRTALSDHHAVVVKLCIKDEPVSSRAGHAGSKL